MTLLLTAGSRVRNFIILALWGVLLATLPIPELTDVS